jgi:hypothetical protein
MIKLINKLLNYCKISLHSWNKERSSPFYYCNKCGIYKYNNYIIKYGIYNNNYIIINSKSYLEKWYKLYFCSISDKEYNIRNILE